jgi:hypothetical protein
MLVIIAVVTASCSKSGSTNATADAALGLDAYCTNAPCRRHDDAVSQLRELTRAGSGCTLGDVGACGALRFVRYSDGYWSFIEWFDAKDTMVAAESWSDISPRKRYGDVPSCELKPAERLCTPNYPDR